MLALPSFDTHLIVWPEAPTRAFVPCLDSRLKPKRVTVLCHPGQVARVKAATDEFQRYGIRAGLHVIPESLEFGDIRAKVAKVVAELGGSSVALNLSGHNTPISLAAYDLFRERQWPAFTIGTYDDQLTWLCPEGMPGFDLEDRVNIVTFLRLNGFEVAEAETTLVTPERRELARQLIHNLEDFGHELHTFNWLATEAEGSLVTPPVEPYVAEHKSYQELLTLFSEAGLLAKSGNRLEFRCEDARKFVCGSWLEDHVFSEIRGLSGKGGVQDIGRGVKFYAAVNGQRVENELDVVFLADNRLYFIECKTVRMKNTPEGFAQQNGFLYKLHSLKSAVGELNTRAMLVSYKSLGNRQWERSQALGLELCSGSDLADIKATTQKWIASHN